MKLLENSKYAVERAALDDVVTNEDGEYIVHDERVAAVKANKWYKCVFKDLSDFDEYSDKYAIKRNVCILGAPLNAPERLGVESDPCVTYAYLKPMPPVPEARSGTEIKRLGASLAQTVLDAYHNPGGGYTVERIAEIMRTKGIFGAITDGKLAGFIGRHGDGNMGMLEVFEPYRRKGLGAALEKFMIGYVMTFGRVPLCDVYIDNPASLALQNKLGLTPGMGYTYWMELGE